MVNPTDFDSQADYEAACAERVATPSEARAEYAANAGAEDVGRQWILTPWDTWERNPHYSGPEQRHPEADPEDAEMAPPAPWRPWVPSDATDDLPF